MANEPIVTIIGNAIGAELRFTPSGKAVCNFSLASTPRRKDGDEWVDGETTWFNCSLWDKAAENFTETFGDAKSLRVIVSGRLSTRAYEDRDGNKRTSLELQVDEIGPSLRYATAVVTRTQGSSNGGQSAPRTQSRPQQQAADPWANAGSDSDAPF